MGKRGDGEKRTIGRCNSQHAASFHHDLDVAPPASQSPACLAGPHFSLPLSSLLLPSFLPPFASTSIFDILELLLLDPHQPSKCSTQCRLSPMRPPSRPSRPSRALPWLPLQPSFLALPMISRLPLRLASVPSGSSLKPVNLQDPVVLTWHSQQGCLRDHADCHHCLLCHGLDRPRRK